MTTLIAILQFAALQGITLQDFAIETHDYYYSATKCEQYQDKDALLLVCAEEKKIIVVKKKFIQ